MDEDHNTPVRIIVKKKRGHGGAHGGAWKVAYADFVTAMMALFIVLWIVGQSQSVKQAISAYFKDPGVFTSGRTGGILPDAAKTTALPPPPVPQPADTAAAEMEKLKAEAGKIEKEISQTPEFKKFVDKIHLTVTEEGLRIDLVEASEGLFFDIGKAKIKAETVKLLKIIATHLATLQNNVVVEGYTDARPYVSSGYTNWDLSTDRANSARKVLEENGLRKNQIVQVRGFADRRLRVPDKPLDFSNRRVSILVASRLLDGKPKQPAATGPGAVRSEVVPASAAPAASAPPAAPVQPASAAEVKK
jgi:chemotaxis protein MotB